MPSPPKDRPSGRLGRLLAALRPSRAGPLPVQTGFPTSLADLVVKNHGRLKKQPSPSSKRRKGIGAASASSSPSPVPSPPPASPPPAPPAPAAPAVVAPADRPRPDLPPARPARRGKGGGFGLGLGFLALGGVVSLALLVIWSKKVVAAVTVASLSLFLLESLRPSPRPRRPSRPPAAPAEGRIYLEGRGRVSPIREVGADEEDAEPARPSCCCSDSDRGTEASALAAEESSGALDGPSNHPGAAKTKRRPWKKLIAGAKKLHKGRKSRDADASVRGGNAKAEAEAAGSLSRRGAADQRAGAVAEDAVAGEPDSSRGSSRRSQDIVEIDAAPIETEAEEDEEGGKAGIRFPALVVVAVALVGLVAGKAPAVALTVLCAAFLRRPPPPAGGGGAAAAGASRAAVIAVN